MRETLGASVIVLFPWDLRMNLLIPSGLHGIDVDTEEGLKIDEDVEALWKDVDETTQIQTMDLTGRQKIIFPHFIEQIKELIGHQKNIFPHFIEQIMELIGLLKNIFPHFIGQIQVLIEEVGVEAEGEAEAEAMGIRE